jgi:hypothetical protein
VVLSSRPSTHENRVKPISSRTSAQMERTKRVKMFQVRLRFRLRFRPRFCRRQTTDYPQFGDRETLTISMWSTSAGGWRDRWRDRSKIWTFDTNGALYSKGAFFREDVALNPHLGVLGILSPRCRCVKKAFQIQKMKRISCLHTFGARANKCG